MPVERTGDTAQTRLGPWMEQGHSVLIFGHKWASHVEAGTVRTKRFGADSYQYLGSLG